MHVLLLMNIVLNVINAINVANIMRMNPIGLEDIIARTNDSGVIKYFKEQDLYNKLIYFQQIF